MLEAGERERREPGGLGPYIDEQAIRTVMRFAGEPAERVTSRQITRVEADDPRGPFTVERARSISASRTSTIPPRSGTTKTIRRVV